MSGLIANTYSTPEWLTREFLQTALREGLRRGSLDVRSCTIKPATNIGDNYLSQMFRASARINSRRKGSEDFSVVIKSMPTGEIVENFVNEQKFFTREAAMLSETLPQLQAVLDEIGGQRLFARLISKQDPPNNSLILEDLCQSGFQSVNRLNGLDHEHSTLVVEYLAIFHAASLTTIQRHPYIKEKYAYNFWQRSNAANVKKFFNQDILHFARCLKVWNFPEETISKVEKLNENGAEKIFQCTDVQEDDLNVLNHADPWVSNIMFKYENQKPVDLRFVDFQLCCYNSAVFDLLYFIFTSIKIDLRVEIIDNLLESYHSKLFEICKKLNYPLEFSLNDLKKSFKKRLFFGFFNTVVMLPFMMVDSSEVTDLNDYLEGDPTVRGENLTKNMRYKIVVETVLPYFEKHNILDW